MEIEKLKPSPYIKPFDQTLETKLKEAWPMVESALENFGFSCTLNLALRILNDGTHLEIIRIGHQPGGMCAEYGIKRAFSVWYYKGPEMVWY